MNKEKIQKLKEIIETELTPLIDSDYVLLDIPDHNNIGDNLIWEGELHFLRNIPFNKKYECSLTFFEQKKIPERAVILMHGGGNFGDIYPVVNDFRKKVISTNLDKKIIILPQTIHYNSELKLEENAKIFNLHSNLIICVRDTKSYEIAKKYFYNAKVLLLPDMAFCIDLDMFMSSEKSNKKLLMSRKDGEKIDLSNYRISYDDLLDWPTFNMSKEERFRKIKIHRRMDKVARFIQKIPIFNLLVDPRYGFKNRKGREDYIKQGILFFQKYDTIYTTRLHGLILGILMGKNMVVLDNNYGKLSNFTKAWLNDFEKVTIYKG